MMEFLGSKKEEKIGFALGLKEEEGFAPNLIESEYEVDCCTIDGVLPELANGD